MVCDLLYLLSKKLLLQLFISCLNWWFIMTKNAYLSTVYQSFSGYEKSLLQEKREAYEAKHSIKFISLQAYVNHLYEEMNKHLGEGNMKR